jgi:phage-related protein
MDGTEKPLVWLEGEVKSPPFSQSARLEAGYLLRQLQEGNKIALPHSRPVPSIDPRCHEFRIVDERDTWRIVYRNDSDAIIILDVFSKKTRATPKRVIEICKKRLRHCDESS